MPRAALSIQEFARIVGLSERTIRRWIALGRLPVTRVGRRVLVLAQPAYSELGIAPPGRGLVAALATFKRQVANEIARRGTFGDDELEELGQAHRALIALELALDAERT